MNKTKSEIDPPVSSNYPDDSFVSDDEIEDLTRMDYDRSVIMNMAGPMNAKKAVSMMHRIMGEKEKKINKFCMQLPTIEWSAFFIKYAIVFSVYYRRLLIFRSKFLF